MIQSVKVNNSEVEYLTFWNWEKIFIIIPGLSLKSVLLSEEAILASFSKFTNDFTIYVFDRIKNIPNDYSIYDMAEDTYNAMINIWIKSCNIFGASQWWMIAQCIAIKHPKNVEKMILWSTAYKVEHNARKIFLKRIELAKLSKTPELNKNFIKNVYCEETIKKYWDMILQSNANISYALLDFNVEQYLWKIKCKTLVIWSNNDQIFGGKITKNLAKKLNCELYLYNEYGHAVYDEAPDFRNRMLNFLLN